MTYIDTIRDNKIPVVEFDKLSETGLVKHGFSTRKGGVSEGCFSSMNLGFNRGDNEKCVRENFRIMGERLGVSCDRMVLSAQTHTTNIRIVTKEDCGKGIIREKNYTDVDGLITNEKGIMLVTFYADCVPLYFLDKKNKVIALSHSGWRGTINKMGLMTVKKMSDAYGSKPEDIIVCIGPSICSVCYEVGEDVAKQFEDAFGSTEMFYENTGGKYQLDLWKANEVVLLEAGVLKENIENRNICTCCNSDLFFSHRKTGGKRGSLAAFLMLNE